MAGRPGRRLAEAAMLEHCRTTLVAFKVPRAIVVCEAIPKNANRKVDRDALSALWERQR